MSKKEDKGIGCFSVASYYLEDDQEIKIEEAINAKLKELNIDSSNVISVAAEAPGSRCGYFIFYKK